MLPLRQSLLALFSAALLQAGPAGAQTAIAIGGALKFDNDAVWKRIVDEAGGPGARFAVFATAAGNPERSARQIIEALNRNGAQAEHIPVAPRLKGEDLQARLHDPALIARVRESRGVYFSGGAQELIVDTLQPGGRPTEMLKAIWSVFERGGVVAGSSAGAAIMSRTMFRDAQDALKVLKGQLREGIETDRGLGFVGPDLFIDQHFLKRGRFGRMLPLMQAQGYRLGLGVEENSAAIIRGGEIEVIGAKGALLVDLGQATHDAKLAAFNVRGASLSYLDRGDRHSLKSGLTTPSPHKSKDLFIDPHAAGFKPYFKSVPFYPDMLGDTTIVNAMGQLLDSPASEARGLAFSGQPLADDAKPDLAFEFRLYKGPDTRGWFTGAFGGEDYTVVRMQLDVQPVQIRRPLYLPINAAQPKP
ncbi:cyanophycinase [Paucibacter sp. PLA-PC-4]|uniref:cyanophycinase n=1 Tax=Paucibacter sp. PLA-PC-4 TaxID=2993655 RepID=UPI00224B5009|nr:cyanophycinase [Paucibacter sp. PLA-PC-4]MCX2865095.1 cyanophycinase [Paucibacter sp. PLA-PC-4]